DRTQIQIPVEARGWCAAAAHGGGEHILNVAVSPGIAESARCLDRRHTGGSRQSLRPVDNRPVGPNVYFVHGPDDAGAYPFVDEARPFARVPLIAHLGDELGILER